MTYPLVQQCNECRNGECGGVHVQFCRQRGFLNWLRGGGTQIACLPEQCHAGLNDYRPDLTQTTLDENLLTKSFGKFQ